MKSFLAMALVVGAATVSWGYEPLSAPRVTDPVFFQPEPTPADVAPPSAEYAPAPQVAHSYPSGSSVQHEPGTILHCAPSIRLYDRVRVHQARNIHPQAVPMIIAVPNPAPLRNPCCECVYIEVCVPPCDPTCIKCNCRGNKISYEFGCYAVNIHSRLGVVVVDYDN